MSAKEATPPPTVTIEIKSGGLGADDRLIAALRRAIRRRGAR